MIVMPVFRIQGQGGGRERAVPPRAAAGERVQHPDREDVITSVFSEGYKHWAGTGAKTYFAKIKVCKLSRIARIPRIVLALLSSFCSLSIISPKCTLINSHICRPVWCAINKNWEHCGC